MVRSRRTGAARPLLSHRPGEGGVWVANRAAGTLARVDPQANKVAALIKVGEQPVWVAVAGGSAWVSSDEKKTVCRIDPKTNQVVHLYRAGESTLAKPLPTYRFPTVDSTSPLHVVPRHRREQSADLGVRAEGDHPT